MDKKASLLVLIKYSLLLSDEAKKKLLSDLNKMTNDEVMKLGRLLALEKKKSLEGKPDLVDSLSELIGSSE